MILAAHFLSPGGAHSPHFTFVFIATLRGQSQGLCVTGENADFEAGHIQLSHLGTDIELSESRNLSGPTGFLARLLVVASETLWKVPHAMDATE